MYQPLHTHTHEHSLQKSIQPEEGSAVKGFFETDGGALWFCLFHFHRSSSFLVAFIMHKRQITHTPSSSPRGKGVSVKEMELHQD